MRILFLTPELPYPARGGGTIKSGTLLDYLTPRHEVDLMCLRRGELTEEQSSWAREFGSVVTVRVRGERTPWNLLRSYAAGIPLSILRNRSARFTGLVQERIESRPYDAVFADSWLMAQHVPPDLEGMTTLHQHNAEFVMWERQAAIEPNPFRRALVRSEAGRVPLQSLAAGPARIELLPNVAEPGLLDRPDLSPPRGTGPVILYLGTLSWQPNMQGLRGFVRDAFPLVRKRLPEARLVVGGRGAPADLSRLARRVAGVELIGAFDDSETLYRRARAFVEVARGGSGTRVKLLNALARGLPVVTTPDGAEGLDIRPGEHVLVGSSPSEISDALVRVMIDDALWKVLSENGRRLVRDLYVPDRAYRALDEVFAADRS